MQESGIEWIGEIPHDWGKYRVKDISEFSPAYSGGKPKLGDACTVIPMESVSNKGELKVSKLQQYKDVIKGLTLFENGDVIFAKITPCMENGKGAYVETLPTQYAFGSTEFHVIRATYELSGKFLYYYTFNDAFRDYAAVNMTGAAGQKRVSTNFLKYTLIYLPELSEQQKIAAYLDQHCVKLDKVIALKQQQIKTLEALRQSTIFHVVTKGLDDSAPLVDSGVEWVGNIPKSWKVNRIKDFGKVMGGFAFKSSNFCQKGVLVLKIANVSHLSLKWDDTSYLPNRFVQTYPDYIAPPHSLIFALTRPIIKAGIKTVKLLGDESFLINQRVGFLKPSKKINSNFLIYVTQSSSFIAHFTNKITLTIQPNISTEQIESIKICCPPIEEQHKIANYLDQETQRLNTLKENLNQQITSLKAYKKSLIYEMVTGKKRV